MRRFGMLALVLCACASGGGTRPNGLGATLRERQFLSESVVGQRLVAGTQIRLTFGPTELSVNAGCNHLFGSYRIEDNVLRMTGLGSAEMGCDAELHRQDEWIERLLMASPAITLAEPRVTLSAGSTRLTLVDRRVASPDRPLVGTRWIGNGSGGESTGLSFGPGSDAVTLSFGGDGSVAVFTACQHGTGQFSADGKQLVFTQLAYDGQACADPNLETTSKDVLFVLDGSPVTYEIREASLTIHRGDRLLMFREGDKVR